MSRPIAVLTGLPSPARDALASWLGCETASPDEGLEPPGDDIIQSRMRALRDLADRRPTTGAMDAAFCSTDAAWMLDELGEEAPDLLIVAGYQSPWSALDALIVSGPDASPAKRLEQWCRYHERLLGWRERFPDRCLFFHADHAGEVLDEVQSEIAGMLGRNLKAPIRRLRIAPPADSARATLLGNLLEPIAPRAIDIYWELEGCAALFGRAPDFEIAKQRRSISLDLLLQQWARWTRSEKEAARLGDERAAIETRIGELESALEKDRQGFEKDRETFERERGSFAKDRESFEAERETFQKDRETFENDRQRLSAQLTESEARLARAITLGEEQSRLAADREAQVIQLGRTRDELAQAKDNLTRQLAELQQRAKQASLSDDEKKERDQLRARVAQMEQEAELTTLQLHQVQEELEQLFVRGNQMERMLKDFAGAAAEAQGVATNSAIGAAAPPSSLEDYARELAGLRALSSRLRSGAGAPAPTTPAKPKEAARQDSRAAGTVEYALANLHFARMSAEYWQLAFSAIGVTLDGLRLDSIQALLEWYRGEFLIKIRPDECGFALQYFQNSELAKDDWGSYVHIQLKEPESFVQSLPAPDKPTVWALAVTLAKALSSDTGIDAQTGSVRKEIALAVQQCQQLAEMLVDKPKSTADRRTTKSPPAQPKHRAARK